MEKIVKDIMTTLVIVLVFLTMTGILSEYLVAVSSY